MSRKSEFQTESRNPAKQFLEWKSEKQCLSFYDKEKGQNVDVPLPFTFLVLAERHTVQGFNDASNSSIFANDVKFIGDEELVVKSWKGGEIAKGLYKDIKAKVQSAGGHYSKSIYAMTKKGVLINIQLKGSATASWGEFTQKTRSRLTDEWVTVTGAQELQKGKVKYSVPTFAFNQSLSDAEGKLADKAYEEFEEFEKGKSARKVEAESTYVDAPPMPPVEAYEPQDENPF
jgi:hypothetical protein